MLLYFLARRVIRVDAVGGAEGGWATVVPPAFAALAFAIHPLRVESVAWVTERRDVLSRFFSLATVLLFLRAQSDRSRFPPLVRVVHRDVRLCTPVESDCRHAPALLLILNVYPMCRVGGAAGWWSVTASRAYAELLPFAMASLTVGVLSVVVLRPGPQLPDARRALADALERVKTIR